MDNNIKVGDILEFKNNDYGILDIISYGGIKYALANMMKDKKFLDTMIILKIQDNMLYQEKDEEILNILMKIFEKNMEKNIVNTLKEEL